MAALLVAMAVMAIAMSALLPVWHTLTVREKESELMLRGQQYDRAIQLYRKKNAAPGPPNLDALIQGRFLRKKFKDPITNDDFALIGVNAAAPAGPGATQAAAAGDRVRAIDWRRPQQEQGAVVQGAGRRDDVRRVDVQLCRVEEPQSGDRRARRRSWGCRGRGAGDGRCRRIRTGRVWLWRTGNGTSRAWRRQAATSGASTGRAAPDRARPGPRQSGGRR